MALAAKSVCVQRIAMLDVGSTVVTIPTSPSGATTGVFDSGSADWVYGGYQISQELASCTTTPCTLQQITSAPEPATIFLFGSGLIAVAAGIRRRRLAGSKHVA